MTQTAAALVQKYEPQNMQQFLAMAQGSAPTFAGGGETPDLDAVSGESGVTQRARERAGKTTEVDR